jgi:hypothetical protein
MNACIKIKCRKIKPIRSGQGYLAVHRDSHQLRVPHITLEDVGVEVEQSLSFSAFVPYPVSIPVSMSGVAGQEF